MIRGSISFKGRAADMQSDFKGTWCSGITPVQHAGGPGFNPQCVHLFLDCIAVNFNFTFMSKSRRAYIIRKL